MKCNSCGIEYDAMSVYCPVCGERGAPAAAPLENLESDDDLAPPPAPPAPPAPSPAAPASAGVQQEELTMSDRLRAKKVPETGPAGDTQASPSQGWTEGGYSGKAMRGYFLLALLFTVPFVALGAWLEVNAVLPEGRVWHQVVWGILLAIPLAAWIYLWCIYIYRVWTIRYRLTEFRFFHEEGIFRRQRDVIEVVDIDDLRLEQTLIDRLINGGVGTVIIHSTDQSDPELRLIGLENPEAVFEAVDEARRHQRTKLGLKAI